MSNSNGSAETIAADIRGLLNALKRLRTYILSLVMSGALVGVMVVALTRQYSASVVFAPESGLSAQGRLAGVAAQFGLAAGATDGNGPDVYAALLRSRTALLSVGSRRHPVDDESADSATLREILDIDATTPRNRDDKLVKAIRERVRISVEREAGLVRYSVSMPSAATSESVAAGLMDQVHSFNQERRRARAAADADFYEARSAAVRSDLSAAERAYADFLVRNRRIDGSPELAAEQRRLQRAVDLRQQLFITLVQSLDQSALERAKDTPVITVVDGPAGAAVLRPRLLFGLVAGAMVGAAISAIVLWASMAGLLPNLGPKGARAES